MLNNHMLVFVILFMSYIGNFILKFSNYSTIQKSYCRQIAKITMSGIVDVLRLDTKFSGVHFKRWQVKVTYWF